MRTADADLRRGGAAMGGGDAAAGPGRQPLGRRRAARRPPLRCPRHRAAPGYQGPLLRCPRHRAAPGYQGPLLACKHLIQHAHHRSRLSCLGSSNCDSNSTATRFSSIGRGCQSMQTSDAGLWAPSMGSVRACWGAPGEARALVTGSQIRAAKVLWIAAVGPAADADGEERLLLWAVDGLASVVLGPVPGLGATSRTWRTPRALLWGQHIGQLQLPGTPLCCFDRARCVLRFENKRGWAGGQVSGCSLACNVLLDAEAPSLHFLDVGASSDGLTCLRTYRVETVEDEPASPPSRSSASSLRAPSVVLPLLTIPPLAKATFFGKLFTVAVMSLQCSSKAKKHSLSSKMSSTTGGPSGMAHDLPLHDLKSRQLLGHCRPISMIAVHPQRCVAVTLDAGGAILWATTVLTPLASLPQPGSGAPRCVLSHWDYICCFASVQYFLMGAHSAGPLSAAAWLADECSNAEGEAVLQLLLASGSSLHVIQLRLRSDTLSSWHAHTCLFLFEPPKHADSTPLQCWWRPPY